MSKIWEDLAEHLKQNLKIEIFQCQKNPDVVALLFNEAMRNFLSGFCSGREDDNVFFAAIIAILRFGQEQIQ